MFRKHKRFVNKHTNNKKSDTSNSNINQYNPDDYKIKPSELSSNKDNNDVSIGGLFSRELDINSSTITMIDNNNFIESAVMVSDYDESNTTIAGVAFMPKSDDIYDITVYDKNNNIIAETNDIGLIGITVKNQNIKPFIDNLSSVVSELTANYNRMIGTTHDLTKGFWLDNK